MQTNTKSLVYTAVFAALIFVATRVLIIPVPFGNGYIHFGDCMIFLAAYHLGSKKGAVAAGVGSALADLLSPYAIYTIPTLIIKGLMGYIAGTLLSSKYVKRDFSIAFTAITVIWSGLILFLKTTLLGYTSASSYGAIAEALGLTDTTTVPSLIQTANTGLWVLLFGVPTVLLLAWFVIQKLYHKERLARTVFVSAISGLFMVMGYFLVNMILYGSYLASIFSISGDVIQFGIGIVLSQILLQVTDRVIPAYSSSTVK